MYPFQKSFKKYCLLQHDEKDCGAAALGTIAHYYGLKLPLVTCRQLIQVDNSGASMLALIKGAEKISFDTKALAGSFEELKKYVQENRDSVPFIARIYKDVYEHYVVIFRWDKKIALHDPAIGYVEYSESEFAQAYAGQVVTFHPNHNFQKGNCVKGHFKKYLSLISVQKKLIVYITLLSLLISGISWLGSLVFEYIVNTYIYTEKILPTTDNLLAQFFSNIGSLCITIMILYLFQGGIQVLRGWMLALISKRMNNSLVMGYWEHLIHLPLNFFTTRKSGEILSRFSDTASIQEALSGSVLTLIIESMMTAFFGCYLIHISFPLFCIASLIMLCYGIIVLIFKKPLKELNYMSMENSSQVTSYLKESIDGIEVIKAYRIQESVLVKAKSLFNKFLQVAVKNALTATLKDTLIGCIASIGIIVLLWTGNSLVINHVITLGSLVSFYVLMAFFLDPVKNLIELQTSIQTGIVAAERLNDVMELSLEENEKKESHNSIHLKEEIAFHNITFSYGYRPPVLKNLSATIPYGTKVAIVGESGSGKTTLMKLLMRFYNIEQGSITIGGKNIHDFSLYEFRSRIAYIPQDIFFFSDTIRNNLILGNLHITDSQIKDVLKSVKADDFISHLPMGLDTPLSENASDLSGGQRQRLALARAFLKKPDVLILDEATSNLDTITEQSIKDTIFRQSNGITTFIIAHRLSTIQHCDLILVISDGHIVESGTHESLIAANGLYKKYWESNL